MTKHILIAIILFFTFTSSAQEVEHQIGLNLTGEYYDISGFSNSSPTLSKIEFGFANIVTGFAVSYTNQKRYISLGSNFYNPISKEFKFNEFDIHYRYYPNIPLRTFNLFFCLGLDYKFLPSKYTKMDELEGKINIVKDERIIGVNFGFGFQVNLSDQLNFHTSISNYMYVNNEDISRFFENTQATTSTNSTYFYARSTMMMFGVTYNLNISKNEPSDEL